MLSSLPLALLVDDDTAITTVLGSQLKQAGWQVLVAGSGAEALALLEQRPVDVLITDLRMPGIDGMALLRRVVQEWPEVPVIVLSAHGTVALAVDAMKLGAADFLTKPFDRDELLYVASKALTRARGSAAAPAPASHPALAALGDSKAMAEVRDTVRRCATSSASVLIQGESGVGKEVVARAIHESSARRDQPFIKINCAALPDTLLESELFGYEKGAFTGAGQRKPGRIELAHGGTLLLDEIGDVSPITQLKLLRVIQTKELERLGGTQSVKVDVRFLTATHRNLQRMVEDGTFRHDLYYRIDVINVQVPPLRDRPEDVAQLGAQFARTAATANGRDGFELAADAVELLLTQAWPGNVRQLENFVERLVVLSDGPRLSAADVQRELRRDAERARAMRNSSAPGTEPRLEDSRKEAEKRAIVEALARAAGNRSLAARLLGISRRTLYTKLGELGLGEPSA